MESDFSEAYQQELLEGLTEALNTVYVAFTRARQRLYVCSMTPGKIAIDELGQLNKLLWEVCQNPLWETAWDGSMHTFNIGSLEEKLVDQQLNAPSSPITQLRISPYEDKVNIRTGNHLMFTLLDTPKASHIREGILVHSVLERLNQKSDLLSVLDQMEKEGTAGGKRQKTTFRKR